MGGQPVSLTDEVRSLEQRIAKRMRELEPAVAKHRELEPLVDEYRELEQLASRMGIDRSASARRTSASSRPSSKRRGATPRGPGRPGSRRPRRSAQSADRAEQLQALVRQRPGVTVAEGGRALGVDPTSLYRVVRRLEREGTLKKDGRHLQPAA